MKKVVIEKAQRLYQLPPDIFSAVRAGKKPPLMKKSELLDLGSFRWPVGYDGDTARGDLPLAEAGKTKIENLKEELAGWFLNYHGAKLNSSKEIFVGGGISDLIFRLGLAFIDNGDIAFVPDVGVPLYRRAVAACSGEPISYAVVQKNDWLPDFKRVNSRLGRVARLLFVNSPHNPTGAELGEKAFEELLWLSGRENIIVVNDAAYQSVSGRKLASLVAITGGKKIGVEVYSFAYLFGLPPIPFGFVVGNREVINGLEQASRLVRQQIPEYYVDWAMAAIRQVPGENLKKARKLIQQSSTAVNPLLDALSLERVGFDAVPFVWARIERRGQAATVAAALYRRGRILTAPGHVFGDNGEGYLRLSLTAPPEMYRKACERVKKRLRLVKGANLE